MKKYIATKVKVRKVVFQTMIAVSGPSVYSSQAEENSEGLSKGSDFWSDEEEDY